LSTALFLQRYDPGWTERLVVIEKRAHPRHKLCAGGITRLGLDLLDELGLRLDVPQVPVRQVRFEYHGQFAVLWGDPMFAVTQRAAFDAWLADRTRERGINLIENIAVADVSRERDGLWVHTDRGTIRTRAVVIAEGSKRTIRRRLFPHSGRSRVARTLEIVVPAHDEHPLFSEGMARFILDDADRELQGYAWAFPSLHGEQKRLNIGVYDARIASGRRRARLVPILRETVGGRLGCEELDQGWQGHPIHLFSPYNPMSAPGVLLVGDAAGVDPLFGEGVAVAMGYAKLAAETLQRAFANGDFRFRRFRRRVLLSPLGRYLMVRWLLANLIYRGLGSRVLMVGIWEWVRFLTWLIRLGRTFDKRT
jgi:flavin-dependent dehydrogenase